MTDYQNIPPTLAETPNWLCFRLVDKGGGRLGKPPVSPRTGQVCAKNDETQFTTLTEALVGMERFDLDGVGFVFVGGFVAIDLDDCFDDSGAMLPVAQNIYDHFDHIYWEYSPSGNGLHGFMRGTKPNDRTKDSALGIEVYSGFNFVTVTGDHVEGSATDIVDAQDALEWLYAEYLPATILTDVEVVVDHGARTADEWLQLGLSRDTKLKTLYDNTDHDGDESSADFALLTKLAYWLNRDAAAIEDAFLASPWCRTKDKAHTRKIERVDYFNTSIDKAIALTPKTAQASSAESEVKAVRFFSLTPQADGSESIALEDYTDLGNAKAMAAVFGDVLCYTPEWGWCFFDGIRWETDVSYRAMEASRDIAQGIMVNAKDWVERVRSQLDDEGLAHDGDEGKARLRGPLELYKHAMKSQSEHGITAMVALNKAYMVSSAKSFNSDPWLLNTPKGVIDLKTGELMPHDSKYRLTNMTATAPARMPTPMWDAFLDRIFCGDKELIEFVQVALGSALVGKVYSENLIIANGTGANGKSTLFNVVQYLLGDYATAIDPDLLMSTKASEQQVGMAMLQGKRFAVAQETEEGQRLKSSMLKRLVSTDKMVAKKLYKDPHEFVPEHMLVLSTNHLPKVSSTDVGTWRRIVVLPFNATIPPEEIITDFHSLLMEREGDGILQWMIDGAVKFNEMGRDIVTKPKAVVAASSEYRSNEDWLANFLEDCCTVDKANEELWCKQSDLYRRYHKWREDNGENFKLTANNFARALQSAGFRKDEKHTDDRGLTSRAWCGIVLNERQRFNLTQGKKGK